MKYLVHLRSGKLEQTFFTCCSSFCFPCMRVCVCVCFFAFIVVVVLCGRHEIEKLLHVFSCWATASYLVHTSRHTRTTDAVNHFVRPILWGIEYFFCSIKIESDGKMSVRAEGLIDFLFTSCMIVKVLNKFIMLGNCWRRYCCCCCCCVLHTWLSDSIKYLNSRLSHIRRWRRCLTDFILRHFMGSFFAIWFFVSAKDHVLIWNAYHLLPLFLPKKHKYNFI